MIALALIDPEDDFEPIARKMESGEVRQSEMADIANEVMIYATGEFGVEADTGSGVGPSHEEISQLAFHLFQSRGRQHGRDLEDWLQAEQELLRHYA